MTSSRWGHTATLLPSGEVLITGGVDASREVSVLESEIFDPATGDFRSAALTNSGHWRHTAVLLQDGTVLIAGGSN